MAAYVIAQVTVKDPGQYRRYQAEVTDESLAPYGGRFLVRGGGDIEHLDGRLDVGRIAVPCWSSPPGSRPAPGTPRRSTSTPRPCAATPPTPC